MNGVLGQSDGLSRFAVFVGVFLVMASVELIRPKRRLTVSKARRWLTNLGIAGIDALVLRLMTMLAVPVAAVAAAFFARERGLGLLNQVAWPDWIKLGIALLVLDLAIWVQHLVSHKVPLFWRIHQVHHADRDIDVTTAVRFHPIEIALSMLWKIVVVVPLGASPFAVFLFEVILNACAMFNHANIALPSWLDRSLRLFIVTPDMHRVHHSVLRSEHDRNYGFNLSLWDRLFRTYLAEPKAGQQGMTIGLNPYQSEAPTRFGWSLWLPFRRPRDRSSNETSPASPSEGAPS
jgi:sterol desaturase/sphingolipid hydroxylase (fatty acid hydroxylase superfamily)